MNEISDSELDSSSNDQIGNSSDHEELYDSNTFDSDQEEEEDDQDYDAFDDFDYLFDNQDNQGNNQNFTPSASGKTNGKGLGMDASDPKLANNGTPLAAFEKFGQFPEEIQMKIWKHTALNASRTVVVYLQDDSFKFGNHPSTPDFMQACHRARKYGMEHFSAVDAMGVLHDFTDPQQVDKPYFFAHPISDDFILEFEGEDFGPSPAYCPKEFDSERMLRELRAEEKKLQSMAYLEKIEHEITRELERADGMLAPASFNVPQISQSQALMGNFFHIAGVPGSAPAPTSRIPRKPVFPPASVLPHFFTDIRSVGINLHIQDGEQIEFDEMSAAGLQTWTRDTVKHEFGELLEEILDYFPHLEYIFAVVRAYGTSNRHRCASNRGFIGDFEKKKWASVDMIKGGTGCMGHNELNQFEQQARVWLMHEKMDRGMELNNNLEFGLYVQTNVL
ncbi:hypothetical protein ACHAPC_009450 [Botrytis cinerea]|uniref:2EXR domain-containing protein n=1 Tax=Botryotinia fuckeliana (strain T4) TaxID=999810 RepID=G2YT75_BOTF4|nr:hypothetical protein BofuT4_P162680.1 [Botrytis cinerea T4]